MEKRFNKKTTQLHKLLAQHCVMRNWVNGFARYKIGNYDISLQDDCIDYMVDDADHAFSIQVIKGQNMVVAMKYSIMHNEYGCHDEAHLNGYVTLLNLVKLVSKLVKATNEAKKIQG